MKGIFDLASPTPQNMRLAARMCSIVSSTPGYVIDFGWRDIGVTQGVANIAFAAHDNAKGDWMSAERWASAEAMIRTGWRP